MVKTETNKPTNLERICWRIPWFLATIIEIMKMILLPFKDFQQEKSRHTHTHTHTHTLGIYYIGNADLEIEMLSRESYLQI